MVFTPYPDFAIFCNSQDLSLSQRLVIRSDYRKYYPTPLPQTAVLRKPEGNFWTVKWTISQDETISFEDGWSKFVTDNGPIVDGDLLLFTYDGSRSFSVRIFRNGLPVKPKAPIKIQEISDDDEDETDGDDMEKKKDSHDHNTITSLSLGSSDEDYVEVNKAHGSFERGESSQRRRGETVRDWKMYLDDPTNPSFTPTSSSTGRPLVIPSRVIKHYDLKIGDKISFIDKYGELEVKVGYLKDRVVVHKWGKIYRRNDATPEDRIICEILHEGGVVRSIKPHFVRK